MSITEQLRTRLGTAPPFACEHCGLTFDSARLNCPACGCEVRETH